MSRVNPCLLESAGQEILDDDVRALDELYDERAIHSATQIGCDAQLVPVDTEVVRTLAALVEGRAPRTRVVTGSWPLHFDDVGSEVA